MVCHEQTLANQSPGNCCLDEQPEQPAKDPSVSQFCKGLNRLRVPRGDGDLLVVPCVSQVPQGVANNRSLFEQADTKYAGQSLTARRAKVRSEILSLARKYTASLCPDIPFETENLDDKYSCEKPLFVTGHQPELFHPGVWTKNILIDELASRFQGCSLNVVIDSDTVKSNHVTIPIQNQGRYLTQRVQIDSWPVGIPWEELRVVDEKLFESFADRTICKLPGQAADSALKKLWPEVVSEARRSKMITTGLVAGRVCLERKLGIFNYEIPLSLVEDSVCFQDFLAELIIRAKELQQIYNESLARYRTQYRIRSAMQPVPDLNKEGQWSELPIWVWNNRSTVRRSLFVKTESGQLLLSDLHQWNYQIDIDNSSETLSSHLQGLQQQGIRFRTKALMTTAFLRLFLSDWFVHGIGGAKYDEITDLIIARFWNLPAPQFQIATGTLYFPVDHRPPAPLKSSSQLKQQLRYAEENPESLLSDLQKKQATSILELKKELTVQKQQSRVEGLTRLERRARRPENRKRHHEFQQVRNSLREIVSNKFQQLHNEIAQAELIEQDLLVTNSRDYPICCYPLETLQCFEEKNRAHH